MPVMSQVASTWLMAGCCVYKRFLKNGAEDLCVYGLKMRFPGTSYVRALVAHGARRYLLLFNNYWLGTGAGRDLPGSAGVLLG